jgi:ATP-dependent Lhr-like helicase
LNVRIGGEPRYIAVEDSARYRDALGVPLPAGVPEALLNPVHDPIGDLARRYARTHAPFSAADFAARYGLTGAAAESVLTRLAGENRLLEGEFRPGGTGREWTDASVLGVLRRRSLAKLRQEVEPVDQAVLGRFVTAWQGVVNRRRGADALLDAIEQLQGAPLPASILETEILPARLDAYDPGDLDAVMAAGEVVWVGVEPLGDRDGRIALYLADHLPRLLPPAELARRTGLSEAGRRGGPARVLPAPDLSDRELAIIDCLRARGASFFGPLHQAVGGGYPGETVDALWNLAWAGIITNDTVHALRAFTRSRTARRRARRGESPAFRSRRLVPPAAEGRWSLVDPAATHRPRGASEERASRTPRKAVQAEHTAWAAAIAQQLLARHGVLTREAVMSEGVSGGFGLVYPVLKAMEESGRVRRGYFVAGLGATQFALPGALDLLRSMRDAPDDPSVAVLAATDPSNPYGATLKWLPAGGADSGRGPTRTVGATVVLVDGALVAYLARGDRQLLTWLPEAEPLRSRAARTIARVLIDRARSGSESPRGMLIEEIDGGPAPTHAMAPFLGEAGFIAGAMGIQATFPRSIAGSKLHTPDSRLPASASRPESGGTHSAGAATLEAAVPGLRPREPAGGE